METDNSDDTGGECGLRLKGPLRLAIARCGCWNCAKDTTVVALSAAGIQELGDDGGDLECVEAEAFVYDIGEHDMPALLVEPLARLAPLYRPDFSLTLSATTWANACKHCGMLQGAFFMHSEPDGPFFGPPREFNGRWVDLVAEDVVVSDASFTDS